MGQRLGIDLGGTKIEAALLDVAGPGVGWRMRVGTPPGYRGIVEAIVGLVGAAREQAGGAVTVGVGIPGTLSPATGLVKNANTQALIGQALDRDLAAALGQEVRVENDANCFALSEAADGAGAGARCVFGVILGTGCGGGIVVDGRVLAGRNRIAGEWGHTPLPWPRSGELPLPRCWCGPEGCVELDLAGPGVARLGGATAGVLCERMGAGDAGAGAVLEAHADRLARGLAVVVNVLDPDVIVLGGGLSNMAHLYEAVPRRLAGYVFSDVREAGVLTPVVRNAHGDSSGVRGAAWLWPVGG